jgi:hypothetical protein
MPISIPQGQPTLLIRAEAYERTGMTRSQIDVFLSLTDEEFRAEPGLVAVGPIYDAEALQRLVDALEGAGLTYYDDFFELSGGWPEWLRLFAGVSSASSGS